MSEFEAPSMGPAISSKRATTLLDISATWDRREDIALVYRGHRTTYAELSAAVVERRVVLTDLGIEHGNRVALGLGRTPAHVAWMLAMQSLGGIVVPFDPAAPPAEVHADLEYCDVVGIVSSRALSPDMRRLGRWGVQDPEPEIVAQDHAGSSSQVTAPAVGPLVQPDDVAVLLPTSGTLGRPKRVALTHGGILANAIAHADSVGLGSDGVALIVLPVQFGYCHTAQLTAQLVVGGTCVLAQGPMTPTTFAALVQEHRVTTTTLVPSLLRLLVKSSILHRYDLTSLRSITVGGSLLEPSLRDDVAAVLTGVELIETYGLTEAGPRVTTQRASDVVAHPGSVGRPISGVEIEVRGPDDSALQAGSEGDVVVRGPGVMAGYWRRPADTDVALADGWLHTRDRGHLDSDGYLYLDGRSDNLIISRGLNVHAEEIEAVIRAHPHVREVAVAPRYHEVAGSEVVAFVEVDAGAGADEESILRHCRTQVSAYKVPASVRIVDRLPRTATGKVRRDTLAEMAG